jgi:PAS domain S-box-containing protein
MSTGSRDGSRRSASGGCFIVGRRGTIEDVDAGGCALLGYAREDVVGLHGSELVPLDARPATAASLDRMRHGEITRRAGRLVHKDGTVLGIDVTAQRLSDGRLILKVRKLPIV